MRYGLVGVVGLITGTVLAGPVGAEVLEKTVKANMRTAVGGFSATDLQTCYTMAVPEGKVEQQPANGTIEIQVHEWTIPEGKQCAGSKSRGPVIVYTPKKNFKGRDEAVLSFKPTDRSTMGVYTYTLRLTVE